jgi:hypothetical protein
LRFDNQLAAAFSRCRHTGQTGINITITGPVERGDADRFDDVLAELRRQPGFPVNVIELNSPGGSVAEGAAIAARIAQLHNASATVQSGAACASICALMFFAG